MCRFIFVSAAVINAGDKKNEYIDELKHPSIFGVPALLFTVEFFQRIKIRKNDPIFILIRILPRIFIK